MIFDQMSPVHWEAGFSGGDNKPWQETDIATYGLNWLKNWLIFLGGLSRIKIHITFDCQSIVNKIWYLFYLPDFQPQDKKNCNGHSFPMMNVFFKVFLNNEMFCVSNFRIVLGVFIVHLLISCIKYVVNFFMIFFVNC